MVLCYDPYSNRHQYGTMTHYQYGQQQQLSSYQEMSGAQYGDEWHIQGATTNVYPSSSCARMPVFDEWATRSSCAHPSSPVGYGGYKQEFSQVQLQQPDLSAGHLTPDSGLTVSSSDGVSSSDSPVGNLVAHQHQSQHAIRPQIVRHPYEWIKKPSYQTQNNPGKTRTKDKYRVVYSDIQRLELEKEFRYSRYITITRKAELAQMLGLSERQVKIWFQNRRAKDRKQVKKREETLEKEKDSLSDHHLQPMQIPTTNPIGHKIIN